jgi:hypothetical protein
MTFEQQGLALYMTLEQPSTLQIGTLELEHLSDKLTFGLGCLIMSLSSSSHDVAFTLMDK